MTGSDVRPKNVDDIYPLSPMQRLMLLHSLAAPGSRVLSNQFCYRLRGDLDADALRRSWEDVVQRHPSLRTAFIWDGLEQPLQAVRSTVTLPFDVRDARDSAHGAEGEIARLRQDERNRGYTLTRAPLTRVTLARTGEREHVLIWNVHHLIADRWCLAPLLEELRQSYTHRIEGRLWSPPASGTFRDYIAWIGGQKREPAEAYWRWALRGFTRATLIGTGSPQADGRRRSTIVHRPAGDALASLRATAASWRVSVGSTLLAAIGAAVAHECRRPDVMFGLTVSGRPAELPAAETTMGSFINNLPLRVDFTVGDQPLRDLIRGLHAAHARRQPFEYVSLADIREWCDLPVSSDLFDLLAVVNLEELSDIPWPGIEVRAEGGHLDGAHPFVLGIGVEQGRLVLSMTSSDAPRAERFLVRLSETIVHIASAHASSVGDLVSTTSDRAAPGTAKVSAPHSASAPALTASEVLLRTWEDVLAREVSLDDDLLELGATSLQIARAFAIVERGLGRTLPLSALFGARSVRGLVQALGEPAEHHGSLIPIRASGTRAPLFVVPGIGGNVVGLAALARAMSADQPFFGLQSKGLDGTETPRTDIETIAREYAAEIAPAIRGPYVLLGVCWGATVAFEMAQALSASGRPPSLLALLDPANLREDPGAVPRPRHGYVRFVLDRLRLYRQEIRGSSVRASWDLVRSKIQRATELLTNPAAAAMTWSEFHRRRVHEANLRAVLAYTPPSPYSGRSLLLLTRERTGPAVEARLDWLKLIEPSPEVRYVPGSDSGDALTADNVTDLTQALREEIGRLP